MSRLVAVATVAAVLAPTAAHAEPTFNERMDTARFKTFLWPDDEWGLRENQLAIRSAAHLFGIDQQRMLCIAERESGFNEHAYNSSSGAAGIFQHLQTYWRGRVVAYRARSRPALAIRPGASVFNPRANILVSARMMAAGGWSNWTTDSSC